MDRSIVARAAACVVAAFAVACGGGGGGSDGPPDGTRIDTSTLGSATRTLLSRLLERRQACYAASPGFVAWQKRSVVETTASALEDAQTNGRVSYDKAQADLCATWLNGASCAQLEVDYAELDPSCDEFVVGLVTTAGQCSSSFECANGYCTADLAAGTCPGTCAALLANPVACDEDFQCSSGACDGTRCVDDVPGAEDAACGHGPVACQSGLYCDAGTCRARLAAGASCTAGKGWCQTGLGCAFPDGTCRPWGGTGASCLTSACGTGHTCDLQDLTCATRGYLGYPCAVYDCIDGSYCNLAALPLTCVAGTVPVNGACNEPEGLFCAAGGHCSTFFGDGTCLADPVDACY